MYTEQEQSSKWRLPQSWSPWQELFFPKWDITQQFWCDTLAYLTLRLILTYVAFCYGDWGIIIESGFPDSLDSLVWVGAFMHADS